MPFKSKEAQRLYLREWDRNRRATSLVQTLKKQIGRCERCGYDRCLHALSWHHVFPTFKSGRDLRQMSFVEAAKELYFCVLICENCHREAHAGLWDPVALRAKIA